MNKAYRLFIAVPGLVVVLIAGCASPDLRPFADATQAVSESARKASQSTIEVVASTPYEVDGAPLEPTDANHPAKRLETAWKDRAQGLDGLVQYAASLAGVAEAAKKSRENVDAVGDSLEQLTKFIPQVTLPSAAATDLIKLIAQTAIEIKSYVTLRDALDAAHPAVSDFAGLLKADLASLKNIYRVERDRLETYLDDQYLESNEYYELLLDEQQEIRRFMVDATVGADAGEIEAAELRIMELNEQISAVSPEYEAYRAQLDVLIETNREVEAFFDNLVESVDIWVDTHADLVKAFEEKRVPNVALLVTRAEELRAAFEKL